MVFEKEVRLPRVTILRAVPRTDGTCSAVDSKAREYGSTVLASTLDEWIQEGREDLIAGDTGPPSHGSSRPSTNGRDGRAADQTDSSTPRTAATP